MKLGTKNSWVSITVAALISSAFWYAWYSKPFFRNAWLVGNRITFAKIDAQMETGLGDTVAMTAATYWVLSLGIHYFLEATRSKSFLQKIGNASVLWALIVVPVTFFGLLWEFRRLDLMVLDSAHLLAVFLIVASTAHFLNKNS